MSQPAETLADRWTLVEKIDEGAMGEIFRATHAVLGHAVAVKVLNPTVARDQASVERFLREARIAARLQHRHVVRVEDFGVADDGRPFLVMELLRGESLARRLTRSPRPSHGETLEVVRQMAAALDAAHAAGIIHRDLKPENVFLAAIDGATVVKVLDFGVAKFTDALAHGARATASNTLIGTPRYMSPEQARSSRELDGRSDLWALGLIGYEMLTGAHPFEGEAIAELLVAILTHRIPPPTSLRPALPAALDDWAATALARSRFERFPTGKALAEALAEALAGRLDDRVASEPPPPAARAGTVRVKRPPPLADATVSMRAANTPALEAPAPLKVPLADDERTPPRGVESPPPAAPTAPASSRTSWLAAALLGAAAAALLVLAPRPRSASPAAARASLAAPAPPAPRPTAPSDPSSGPLPIPSPPALPVAGATLPQAPPQHRPRRPHRARDRSSAPPPASVAPDPADPPAI